MKFPWGSRSLLARLPEGAGGLGITGVGRFLGGQEALGRLPGGSQAGPGKVLEALGETTKPYAARVGRGKLLGVLGRLLGGPRGGQRSPTTVLAQ